VSLLPNRISESSDASSSQKLTKSLLFFDDFCGKDSIDLSINDSRQLILEDKNITYIFFWQVLTSFQLKAS
jgi:hypothetical protein